MYLFFFQRHFAVFNLPAPQDEALRSIVHGILEVSPYLSFKISYKREKQVSCLMDELISLDYMSCKASYMIR